MPSVPYHLIALVSLIGSGAAPLHPPLQAQQSSITIEVRAADGGEAIAGAAVEVLGLDGRRLRGAFTDAEGTARVDLPRVDSLAVFAERLGYRRGGTGTISWGEALAGVEVRLAALPIELPALTVSDARRCEGEPPDGARLWRVWSDVRTALRAALLTEEEGLVRFEAETWVRDLDSDGAVQEVLEQETLTSSSPPFRALTPEELVEGGYIRTAPDLSHTYYGPDARALLSDGFRDTHCFSLAEGEEGMVELRFTPVPGRETSDIRGVMRVEEESSRLREVVYEYVAPRLSGGDLGGGEIRFRVLEEGPWIVDRWSIRMPLGTSRVAVWLRDHPVHREVGGAVRSIREVGTERAEADAPVAVPPVDLHRDVVVLDPLVAEVDMSARPPRCVPQIVVGRVLDGSTGEPVVGARMGLLGREGREVRSVTSAGDGRFALVTPGPGLYRVRGEAEGFPRAEGAEIPILPGDTIQVEFHLGGADPGRGPDPGIQAGPMVITGSARPWTDRQEVADLEGFFERMSGCQGDIPEGARFGAFLDRSTIREWEDHTHRGAAGAMLVQEIPEVVNFTPEGYLIFSESPRCLGVTFVNGRRELQTTPPLEYLSLPDLEAVEVYHSPHVPREYWISGGQPCGVLAVWTRGGG